MANYLYAVKRLWLKEDKQAYAQWQALLRSSGLQPEADLDDTIGIYDDTVLIAAGSLSGKIIKCVAVREDYRAENLLAQLMTQLLERLYEKDETHCFLYTKLSNKAIFRSLGFREIIADEEVLFMEQGKPDFTDYLGYLKAHKKQGDASAIVMNANPFTKGHQYLVETAARQSPQVYVFVLSEEKSEFSTSDRLAMVRLGVAHLKNVTVLRTEDYLVSSATFPAYFLKDRAPLSIARTQASLDARLFKERIAPVLGISQRFVGEEPHSKVTEVYNQAMAHVFRDDLTLTVIPRLAVGKQIISATAVRRAMTDGDEAVLKDFLPETSYRYLMKHEELMR